jgi:NADH-quinone oxidoreductase subunit N
MMFSLAGIPPLAGFFAKFYAFAAAIKAGLVVLAVIGVVTSVVGAYYYLRIVKTMYFDEPVETAPIESSGEVRALLSLNGAAILLFGVLPGGLMALCATAIVKALAT